MFDDISESPTVQDIHGDSHIRTSGAYENALDVQEEAERLYADMAMSDTVEFTPEGEQGLCEWSAAVELRNVAQRYGAAAMEAVIDGVRASLPLATPRTITTQVRKLDLSVFDGTNPAA